MPFKYELQKIRSRQEDNAKRQAQKEAAALAKEEEQKAKEARKKQEYVAHLLSKIKPIFDAINVYHLGGVGEISVDENDYWGIRFELQWPASEEERKDLGYSDSRHHAITLRFEKDSQYKNMRCLLVFGDGPDSEITIGSFRWRWRMERIILRALEKNRTLHHLSSDW